MTNSSNDQKRLTSKQMLQSVELVKNIYLSRGAVGGGLKTPLLQLHVYLTSITRNLFVTLHKFKI